MSLSEYTVDYYLKRHAREMRDHARRYRESIKDSMADKPKLVEALLRYVNAYEAAANEFERFVRKPDEVKDDGQD